MAVKEALEPKTVYLNFLDLLKENTTPYMYDKCLKAKFNLSQDDADAIIEYWNYNRNLPIL